ncbi:hypothetical protein AUR64_17130 [Haloprofundus marisrubri]|uniref:DUF4013 domain-containing protein n=1 Tax=Haloprofundus marisrubri TaxID=1514971 RepID=A0A0W1R7D1_9EURY|nr:DUF4013 domain-containing protein [Haloprofundus marisrubri]KTG09494.1 hypothetical protein AUR64_17130 [Haloprofundus marisrubri]
MSIDIESDLRYPTTADDWVTTQLVGALVTFVGFLLLFPLFLILGYYLRVARRTMEGDETPPSFTDWGTLFVDGAKAAAVLLAYQLVPILVFALTAVFVLVPVLTNGDVAFGVSVLGVVAGLLVSMLLSLVFGYFGIAAALNVAYEGSVRSGFEFGRIARVAFSREYAVQWLYAFVLSVGINAVLGVVAAVPLVQFALVLLTPLVSFYVGVVTVRIYGRGYAAALDAAASRADRTRAETTP